MFKRDAAKAAPAGSLSQTTGTNTGSGRGSLSQCLQNDGITAHDGAFRKVWKRCNQYGSLRRLPSQRWASAWSSLNFRQSARVQSEFSSGSGYCFEKDDVSTRYQIFRGGRSMRLCNIMVVFLESDD
jgi:hypothetical protein